MSENFDDLLSEVVDTAAEAAREPGAAAARKRGHQRRTHRRVAASTLSLALLGIVGGVAASSLPGHSANGTPTVHVTATTSPDPGASTSPSPSTSPRTSTSASASATGGGSPAVTAADPNTYVAAAWLSAQQMPLYQTGVTQWAYNTSNYGTHLGGHVYALGATGGWVVGCSDDMNGGNLASLTTGLVNAQYQGFTGPNSDKILPNGSIPASTDQAAFFYSDSTQAAAAMNGLATDFARCKTSLTGVNASTGAHYTGATKQTLDVQDAQCWTVIARNDSSGSGGETIHDCFVRSGNVVEEVHTEINEIATFNAEDFPSIDAALIPELQHDLQLY